MSITVLRPTSDSYKQGFTFSTGTVAWSLLDDSPVDDNTYISAANGNQTPNVFGYVHTADTLALSSNQRIKATRYRARIRISTLASGVVATVKIGNRNPFTGGVDFMESFSTAGTTVIEKTGTWRLKPPVDSAGRWGTEWTEFAAEAVQTIIQFFYAWNTKVNLRLTELYYDVDIRDQPTITGTPAVTGATTTVSPVVSWVYTANPDGDPQNAYQVKVFSAAQYGAAGFNPATSTATWSSGEQFGTADNMTVGMALVNGVTYKAYVKVAQDFNGARWYTDWTPSGAFTISLTPPPTPALSVASDVTVPRGLRNTLTVQAHLNLLTADDASLDTTVGSWVQDVVATVARDTAPTPNYGAGLLKLTASSAATMSARTSTSAYPVDVGQTYTALASFRTAVTSRSCSVGLAFYNRAGTIIGAVSYGSTVADGAGGWTAASHTVAAPANAVTAAVFVRVASPANAEIHYADTILLGTSAVASGWSPGGLVGVASTVIERAWFTTGIRNLIHPQLWSGGDDTLSADGFYTSGAGSRVVYDSQERHLGAGSIRWDVNTTTSKLYFGWPSSTAEDPAPEWALACVPGQVYTFAVYAKSTAAFSTVLNLQAIDKGGTAVGAPVASSGISLTTGWVLYQVSITAPANAVYVRPHFDNTATVTERFVWVDSPQWVLGSTVDSTPGQGTGQSADWVRVRGCGAGELIIPADPGDLVKVVHDNEVPPGYTVAYRAANVIPANATAAQQVGGYSGYLMTRIAAPGRGVWVLRDPRKSMRSVRFRVTGMPSESQQEEVQLFYPARPDSVNGPQQRPVAVSDYIGGHDGQLSVICDSEAEWLELKDLLATRATLWMVFPDHGGRWVRFLERSWSRVSQRTGFGPDSVFRRPVTLSYVESDMDG